MIGPQEEATLKGAVLKLTKEVGELNEKIDGVVTAQGKVDSSLQEFATAKRTGTPVQFMKAEIVEKTIKENLNSQLVGSTVNVNVNNATIGKESKEKIGGLIASADGLISAAGALVDSNKSIKPRRPLMNFIIYDGKKFLWYGIAIAGICLIATIWAIVWANKKVNSIQEQAFYWGDRAYQAALLRDLDRPGDEYHITVSHFAEYPGKVREYVDLLEKKANYYQELKTYLISLLRGKDTRDIRVLAWEIDRGEGWFLYRFFDEEIERSIHVWPNGKVEETTDKVVTDLASAQKYSKRKIWRTIKEYPPAQADEESQGDSVQ